VPVEATAYGVQPVRALLAAGGGGVERLVVARGHHGPALREILGRARELGLTVQLAGREALDRLAVGGRHQGVVAVAGAMLAYTPRAEVLAALTPPALVAVLDGVEDPRNLGAVLRTAAATGVQGVFLPERRAAGLTPAVIKAAAGTAGRVPVVRETNVARLLEALKAAGLWVVAVEAGAPPPWTGFDFCQPVALVLGGEGKGIRPLVRRGCDAAVGLPLALGVESLNVSVAFGVVAYETLRQRRAGQQ
jgi:23S rRNA (guanosine2251-2'-O)-methyltransferase